MYESKLLLPVLVLVAVWGISSSKGAEDIPVLQGTHCFESNVLYDFKVTTFEFKWRLRNFKQYYMIYKKFNRQLELSKDIRLERNRVSYTANIKFKVTPPKYASDKEIEYITADMTLQRGLDIIKLESVKEYEYEGEILIRSPVASVTTGPGKGDKSYFGYTRFSFFRKVNVTQLEEIIGVGSQKHDNPIELVFRLNQYQLPAEVATNDIQSSCGSSAPYV